MKKGLKVLTVGPVVKDGVQLVVRILVSVPLAPGLVVRGVRFPRKKVL